MSCSYFCNLCQHFVQILKNPFIPYSQYVKPLLLQLTLTFPVLFRLALVNTAIQFNE